ncbi:aromatase/cyclase [Streptomyces sp. NPDC101152]|uniref:aromatase/cyclase n=1 Tax=Streptomyces sp. NPDC101152 TaxID=3366116 RepID=UPI003807AF2B
MTSPRIHRTEHTLIVDAPAESLYALVADSASWPAVFGPCVHVRHLDPPPYGRGTERFQLWAEMGGEVATWTSRRVLDPDRLYVGFQQEHSSPPFASMGGGWLLRQLPGERTEVVLRHRFTSVENDPQVLARMMLALDRNSTAELAALARIAECGHPVSEVVFSFSDTVELQRPADQAYAFVHRADLWAERLPHVTRSRLTELAPGVQDLEMDTVTGDGSSHTTRSVRVCSEPGWIAYKQRVLPKLLLGHSGLWTFDQGASGTVASARHTVVIDPTAVSDVLGEGATQADALAYVRKALGDNSRVTLALAATAGAGAPVR